MVVGWVDNKGEHPANANVLGGWEKSSRERSSTVIMASLV